MRSRAWWAGLGLVLALAAAVRFARIGSGLDEGVFSPDELEWLLRMRAFAAITPASFDPLKLTYPTLYTSLTRLTAWVAAALGWIPPLDDRSSLAALHVARGVSAAAGVATVAVVGTLGRTMLGPGRRLAAAAFMAVVPLAVSARPGVGRP